MERNFRGKKFRRVSGAFATPRDCRICIALRFEFAEIIRSLDRDRSGTMSAQVRTQLGAIVLIFGILANAAGTARAADCLAAPNGPAPKNSHWFYRIDRAQQRNCWHLGDANQPSQQPAVQTARETPPAEPSPAASPYSLESFKDFMAQRGSSNLSDKDVENLYAEFLEWSRPFRN
jgi:hypothetical protein